MQACMKVCVASPFRALASTIELNFRPRQAAIIKPNRVSLESLVICWTTRNWKVSNQRWPPKGKMSPQRAHLGHVQDNIILDGLQADSIEVIHPSSWTHIEP